MCAFVLTAVSEAFITETTFFGLTLKMIERKIRIMAICTP